MSISFFLYLIMRLNRELRTACLSLKWKVILKIRLYSYWNETKFLTSGQLVFNDCLFYSICTPSHWTASSPLQLHWLAHPNLALIVGFFKARRNERQRHFQTCPSVTYQTNRSNSQELELGPNWAEQVLQNAVKGIRAELKESRMDCSCRYKLFQIILKNAWIWGSCVFSVVINSDKFYLWMGTTSLSVTL